MKKNSNRVGLNFSVTPAVRRRFKLLCAQYEMTLVDALVRALDLLESDLAAAKGGPQT